MTTFKQFLLDEEDTGQDMMLQDGFYMEKLDTIWVVKRLMDDEIIARASVMSEVGRWAFRVANAENNTLVDHEEVSRDNVSNLKKFKWWIWNRLIKHGMVENAK